MRASSGLVWLFLTVAFIATGVPTSVPLKAQATGGLRVLPGTGPLQSSPIPRIAPPQQPNIVPLPAEPTKPAVSIGDGTPVLIADVKFEGGTQYGDDVLGAIFGPIKGKSVTTAQIADAIYQLQFRYRDDGYFLTKVVDSLVVEPGVGNVLVVRVIEGFISSVKLDGDVGPVANLIYKYLRNLEDFRPIRIKELERYVLLAQNVPGVSVRTVLRAVKEQPGAVELIAQVERKKFDANFIDDNHGPKTAGPNEFLVGVAANSFTSLGERTEVVLYNTPFDNEEIFGQASLESFVGSQGLKLRTYAGYGVLEPGDVLRPAGYKSRLLLTGVDAEYPLIRTRALSVYLSGDFDVSQTVIDLNDFTPTADHRASKDNLRMFRFGVKTVVQDSLLGPQFQAADTAEFKVHVGVPDFFGGTRDSDPRPARPNEANDFTKLTLELTRKQQIHNWANSSLALQLGAEGQWTSDILPPSEEMFLGGVLMYGRGFYNGEVTGDRAVAGTAELQLDDSPLQMALFGYGEDIKLEYFAFYDAGQTWSLAPGDLAHHIESAGLGVRANLNDFLMVELEGVKRFTRRPTGTNTSLEPAQALFFRITGQF